MNTKNAILATITLLSTLTIACEKGPEQAPVSGSRSTPAPPSSISATSVELPGNSRPSALAFSSDGTLWATESSRGAIGKLTPDGTLTQIQIPGESTSPGKIVEGPDGLMWFTGFQILGKVQRDDSLTGWENRAGDLTRPGLPDSLTVGADGAVWYADASEPHNIVRVTTDGTFSRYPLKGAKNIGFLDITWGNDGALWFIERSPAAVGTMTTAGAYRRWKLPDETAAFYIVTGPDGALWFTEATHIARITHEGQLTTFPLPPGIESLGITPGPGQTLWFTTQQQLGRITTEGTITLWPVSGAKRLGSITTAQDGSLWIADQDADLLWHLTPPS